MDLAHYLCYATCRVPTLCFIFSIQDDLSKFHIIVLKQQILPTYEVIAKKHVKVTIIFGKKKKEVGTPS